MPYNKLQPDDELLVDQGGESYSIQVDTLKAEMANYNKLQATDLMLVNRGADSYSVELDTLKEEIAQNVPPVIESVVLSEDDPNGNRFTDQSFTTNVAMGEDGNPPSTKSIRGTVEGSLVITPQTSVITGTVDTPAGPVGVDGYQIQKSLRFTSAATYIKRSSYGGIGTIALWYKSDFPNTPQTIMAGLDPVSPPDDKWYFLIATSITPAEIGRNFRGYLADIHFVDGQALTEDDFGVQGAFFNPKEFNGIYGTNGFHLEFSNGDDLSTVGEDTSGNGNNWQAIGFSLGTTTPDLKNYLGGGSRGSIGVNQNDVNSAFDGNPDTYFGFAGGGYNPDRSKIWRFSSGYPVKAGDTLKGTGVVGGGFSWSVSLANGQSFNGTNYPVITVSSDTVLYEMSTGGFGNGGQYSRINSIIHNDKTLLLDARHSDSTVDTPTNYGIDTGVGGEVRGNYCTFSQSDRYSKIGISFGNLRVAGTDNQYGWAKAHFGVTSGKYYWEAYVNGAQGASIGVCEIEAPTQDSDSDKTIAKDFRNSAYCYTSGFEIYIDGNPVFIGGPGINQDDVIGVAVDADARKVWFSHNGVFQGYIPQDPATDTGGFTPINLRSVIPYFQDNAGAPIPIAYFNFGQRPFIHPAPEGFKTLSSQNFYELGLGFADDTDFEYFSRGDTVTQSNGLASGTIRGVDATSTPPSMVINTSGWTIGQTVVGDPKAVDNATKYLNLSADLNVIGLTDDSSYTLVPSNSLNPQISFGSVLDNGEAPDIALPDGTSIQTEIKASNVTNLDAIKESNTIVPGDTTVLFADNTEDVAKFEAIKESLESYEGDRLAYREELRNRLIQAGFTDSEIYTMGLDSED